MRRLFLLISTLSLASIAVGASFYRPTLWILTAVGPLCLLGYWDILQKKHAILRNFPLLGHFRYLFELVRPEINQYFVESNTDGRPFSREQRSIVYQRAKQQLQTLPFGTQQDVYEEGYQWLAHSMAPVHVDPKDLRVTIGEGQCTHPYSASLLNISAMSYGSLSAHAILALNGGARMGGFAHNTGEGGISPYHVREGGDLIWQIGTGYFGCRTPDGSFDPETFAENAARPSVKMIEIKLSQGAKPGHGGILPAKKLTPEIAAIRGVPLGQDVLSPPAHSAFTTPRGLIRFATRLRELSGGKPVGIKLCVGRRHEFVALCKAMVSEGSWLDYVAVDGGEGGTGAAPLEFSNHFGNPLSEGLFLVHNALVGFGLRDKVRVIASGRIIEGFDIVHKLAIGADLCYSARAMMFALGCIQALRCNANVCPTGVATQDPELVKGLDVGDKRVRVCRFHGETLNSTAELLGAMGLHHSSDVGPWHVLRRTSPVKVHTLADLHDYVAPGAFLGDDLPAVYRDIIRSASPDTFSYQR
ncbi:FMN-binding glutamate synthase family protein [Sulfidibacter corallicola]|uniref:FMN-binding glutamate synthase family protein n=1 Tax=Sulfidibacter corallicola TaxID=2818388 RepID=A0A8A4TPA9_SULCO|nr:FMN-binding glutamate synthase family protein [Sulfidibacter corallicola]QTD51383.1 FMN-binding glutamate synthase family protein [Sulfidibacter corallicola]